MGPDATVKESGTCGRKNRRREKWEIENDYGTVKAAIEIFKDKDRLGDVQQHIKSKKAERESLDAVGDGDLQSALGL